MKVMYVLEEESGGAWTPIGVVTQEKDAEAWIGGVDYRTYTEVPVLDKTFAQLVLQNQPYEG